MSEIIIKNQSQQLENALYVVATPIGNLNDITLRALNILSLVDYVICEDTRIAGILLNNFEIIKKKLIVYNDHSDEIIRNKILSKLQEGNSLALISDAGTPLISDPGHKLINFLRQEKQKIICIPGPSSLTASISISGIACDNFLFLGFLPSSEIAKEKKLKNLPIEFSFIFFDVSNRVLETLKILKQNFANRKICLARELTKIYEEIIIGTPDEILEILISNPQKIRGEFVIIVEKISKDIAKFNRDEVLEVIKILSQKNLSSKEIVKELVENFEINKKEAYSLVLVHQNRNSKNDQIK